MGKQILLEEAFVDLKAVCKANVKSDAESDVKSENTLFPCLTMSLADCPNVLEHVLEAYDCHQGSAWHDGLNLALPSNVLEPQSAKLTTA